MPTDQEIQKDRWTIWVCPPKGTEEGMWSSAETGPWRRVAAYRNLGKPEAVEVCRVSELEAESKRLREELQEVEAVAVRRYEESNSAEQRAEAAEKALREAARECERLGAMASASTHAAIWNSAADRIRSCAAHNDNEEDPNA